MDIIAKFRERLSPLKLHILALGIAIVLGAGVGLMKTTISPPNLPNADHWALPQWAPFQAGSARQELASAPIFTTEQNSKKKSDAVAEGQVPPWRFTGTVRQGDRQIAIIETDKGQHIRRILPGDELPDGSKVTAVRVGELTYTDGTGEQTLKLFTGAVRPLALSNRKN